MAARRFPLASPATALALGCLLLAILVTALVLGVATSQVDASSAGTVAIVVAFGAVGVIVVEPAHVSLWVRPAEHGEDGGFPRVLPTATLGVRAVTGAAQGDRRDGRGASTQRHRPAAGG